MRLLEQLIIFKMKTVILILFLSIKSFGQNPDSHLTFRLINCNKIITFNKIENDTNVVKDISNKFILKTTNMTPKDCGFGRLSNYANTKNEINIDLIWCESIFLEITQKFKKRNETMKINFEGMYQKSASINLKFRKGNYEINLKKLLHENKIVREIGSEIFIKQKYLKRID